MARSADLTADSLLHGTARWMFFSGACLCLFGCGPVGPFAGGKLRGTESPPPSDWSAAHKLETIQLEVDPEDPYSVNLWGIGIERDYYVGAGDPDSSWVAKLRRNPTVRLRVEDEIYPLFAFEVHDLDERMRVREEFKMKYDLRGDDIPLFSEAVVFRLDRR